MPFDIDHFLNRFELGSIAEAQKLYGLPETGEADAMTLRTLAKTPRCGLPDSFAQQVAAVNKWGITDLKWYIESFPTGLNVTGVGYDHEVSEAFKVWQDVSPFRFSRTNQRALAHILFTVGKGPPLFDGRGNIVARAEMPASPTWATQLKVTLDSDEPWSTGIVVNGQGLHPALPHEIGHILGLTHSEIYGQLMHPILNSRVRLPMSEDVQRLEAIYGAKPGPGPIAPPTFIRSRVEAYNRIYEGHLPLTN